MLTAKDLEKYHQAAERILNAMDNSPVPIRTPYIMNCFARTLMVMRFFLIQKSDIAAHWQKMSWQTLIFLKLGYMMQMGIWWP